MNQYVTGTMIRELREKHGLTQAELAEKLNVSDKAVSRWETGKGYPDITLLEPIASVFGISITELLSGVPVSNTNLSSNILRSMFYVCPVCGNVLHAMGAASVSCHGIRLEPMEAEKADERHPLSIEHVEDEFYLHMDHEMTKTHYISFIAAISPDRLQMVRLYPEGPCEARFQLRGVKRFLFCCNRDGLFSVNVPINKKIRPDASDLTPSP